MITGFVLVVLSWLFFLAAVVLLGYPLAYLLNLRSHGTATLRGSLWLGTLVSIIAILAIGIFTPLRSPTALVTFGILLAAGAVATIYLLRSNHRNGNFTLQITKTDWLLIAGLGAALAYLALAALGPVTNYDSGLYHLGAIKYAGDYATIPGIANLYFPLGYNTSLYPVGAFLGNGPWNGNGFRLFNGFLIVLLVVDVVLRLARTKNVKGKRSTGTYFLVIAIPLTLVPLVSLSDYWVTSPSSDAAVLVITLISIAYLLDALTQKNNMVANASVSFTAAVIAFSLRPTMVVFLIGLSLVLLYRVIRTKSGRRIYLLIPAILGIVLLIIQSARDYLLSGWLQYPLSLISFNVPWLASDPIWNRDATLGNARNPADIWGSVEGFTWVDPYLSRLPSQWETFFVAGLAALVIALLLLNSKFGKPLRWKTLILALLPVTVGVITWFLFSPPTFRFGWGVVFSFFLVLIAFPLKAIVEKNTFKVTRALTPTLAFMLITLVGFNLATRFQSDTITENNTWSVGPISIDYKLSPITPMPIVEQKLASDLVVTSPTESDQCWDNYPLCSPIVIPSLSLRGQNLQEGFLP
jgi:hypothetical protein